MTYITGLGHISPQNTLDNSLFLEEVIPQEGSYLSCIEPKYRDYIAARLARRMSKIIKMGVVSAKVCMEDARLSELDGIIVGTGLGCVQDTDKFLSSLIENDEHLLNPTAFIQSTHNTVAGQIALLNHCHCYNITYAQRGFSFEHALIDAQLLLAEVSNKHILVGGIDEVTANYHHITQRMGLWRPQHQEGTQASLRLLKNRIAGEGSAFFMLSRMPGENSYAQLIEIDTFYEPKRPGELRERVNQLLAKHELVAEDIDLLILGNSGDEQSDRYYAELQNTSFPHTASVLFKHLRGESYTSSSFGLWLGAKILQSQHVPKVVQLTHKPIGGMKHVLIYNHYMAYHHTFLLLAAC